MATRFRTDLARICGGRVIDREHPRYDETRQPFNVLHDRRPALICLPRTSAEVQAVIRTAREDGIAVAVRGGGHNVAGSAAVDGGLVIDLRLLNEITIDPVTRTARVGGGSTWARFDAAAAGFGLATTGGVINSTGVGGLTLGGGIGYLMGLHGLACDNVLSYALVDANGERRTVSPEVEPDLDWALRGAGHNFGVVDEFEFRMHEVRTIHGGYVAWHYSRLADAVKLFRDLMSTAPDELTCIFFLERPENEPDPVARISVCYCGGDRRFAEDLDKRLRSLDIVEWTIADRPYLEMQSILGDAPFGLRHYWSARCVDALPDELAEALVERFLAGRWRDDFADQILIEPIHGAVRRPVGKSAVPFRGARFNITGMAIWEQAEADAEQIAWARSVSRLSEKWSSTGDGYINYVTDAHARTRVSAERLERTYSPDGLRRLLDVKRAVDPGNFFRSNYNLAPDSGADSVVAS